MNHSELDTKRFGVKVGKTDGEELLEIPLDKLKKLGYELIIARVSLEDIKLINHLEEKGFRIKDTQLTYKHELRGLDNIDDFNTEVRFRPFEVSDTPHLVQIAKDSFDNYGHYFSDSRLDKQKCLEVYADWTFNICTNRDFADTILIATINDNPVGFLSLKIYEQNGSQYSAGGIMAVSPLNRGQNIAPVLLKAGCQWTIENGLLWSEHNALVTNIPVSRALLKLGFRPFNPKTTMHCWLD